MVEISECKSAKTVNNFEIHLGGVGYIFLADDIR